LAIGLRIEQTRLLIYVRERNGLFYLEAGGLPLADIRFRRRAISMSVAVYDTAKRPALRLQTWPTYYWWVEARLILHSSCKRTVSPLR